jgi:putative tryptophan/tyrosine transport system substrate-binding protein
MQRREFIASLGSAAAWPSALRAQQQSLPTVGWLHSGTREAEQDFIAPFRRSLSDAGFIEGRNVAIEHGWGDGDFGRRPVLIAEFIQRRVAVIVVSATQFAIETKAATQTIPIVFLVGGDPVEFGLVESFNHPGGNVTGIAMMAASLTAKRLELASQLAPGNAPIALFLGLTYGPYAEAEARDWQSPVPTAKTSNAAVPEYATATVSAGSGRSRVRSAAVSMVGAAQVP